MNVEITSISESDCEKIVQESSSENKSQYKSFMRAGEHWAGERFLSRGIRGFGFYCGAFGKSHFRLYVIAIAKSFEGKGLAKQLLSDMKSEVARAGKKKITFKTEVGSRAWYWWNRRGASPSVKGLIGNEMEMELCL